MAPANDTGEGGGEVLQGLVDVVTYHDEQNLYSVLRILPEEGFQAPEEGNLFSPRRVTAVGRAPQAPEGARVHLVGSWGKHPKHGAQFEFDLLQILPPIDRRGLERYLASKAFEGVGPTLAERIVDALGEEALERIAEEPGCLAGIRGLKPEIAERIASAVSDQREVHLAFAYLHGLGLGPIQSQAALRKLGPRCRAAVVAVGHGCAHVAWTSPQRSQRSTVSL